MMKCLILALVFACFSAFAFEAVTGDVQHHSHSEIEATHAGEGVVILTPEFGAIA